MEYFLEKEGKVVVEQLIEVIHANREYLSEIDGAIGDGDHGINMDKGFQMAKKELADAEVGMSEAFKMLGRVLVEEIGGSMGPLYGTFFKRMARASKKSERVTAETLSAMVSAALEGVSELGEAKVGDKTLIDTLAPAAEALKEAEGKSLSEAADAMVTAAETGWRSTEALVAKVGRAARLGERSRGALDAGATSCYLMIKSIGESMKELIR